MNGRSVYCNIVIKLMLYFAPGLHGNANHTALTNNTKKEKCQCQGANSAATLLVQEVSIKNTGTVDVLRFPGIFTAYLEVCYSVPL